MNNRIFELAKQVELIQWDKLPSGAITPDYESVVKAKRFAELIVKECIDLAVKEEERYDSLSSVHAAYCSMSMTNFQEVLKKHFGVEE
jgi:hypothetical protein